MARFWPGQKIKKVRGDFNIGLTGTYVGTYHGYDFFGLGLDILVQPDVPCFSSIGLVLPAGKAHPSVSDHWEPIVPEGLESVEEIEQLYQAEESAPQEA